jgi:hypothetical protein
MGGQVAGLLSTQRCQCGRRFHRQRGDRVVDTLRVNGLLAACGGVDGQLRVTRPRSQGAEWLEENR